MTGPIPFGDWQEFDNYCPVMQDCEVMRSFKDVYCDIRPRPDFGTVEFRVCDAPASLAVTLGLVALKRCLVIWALRILEELQKVETTGVEPVTPSLQIDFYNPAKKLQRQ